MKVSLSEPKKLPEFQSSELWKWNSSKSVELNPNQRRNQGDISQSSLRKREIWLEPATTKAYSLQPHRLATFTEQVASWKVPLNNSRHQKAHAIASLPDDSIHVLTSRPMVLHSFSSIHGNNRIHRTQEIESQYMQWETNPVLTTRPNDNELVIFLPSSDLSIILNPTTSSGGKVFCATLPDGALNGHVGESSARRGSKKGSFQRWFTAPFSSEEWRHVTDASNPGCLLRYRTGSTYVQMLDYESYRFVSMNLQEHGIEDIVHIQPMKRNSWLIQTTNESQIFTLEEADSKFELREATVEESTEFLGRTRHSLFPRGLATTGDHMIHPEAVLQKLNLDSTNSAHVLSSYREIDQPRWGIHGAWSVDEGKILVNTKADEAILDMEVTYPSSHLSKRVSIRGSETAAINGERNKVTGNTDSSLPPVVGGASVHEGKRFVTLEEDGDLRVWQLDLAEIESDLNMWQQMFGVGGTSDPSKRITLKVDGQESVPKTGLDAPKHGKEDPDNTPHVGGNTWAGGTGGSDTAGLGGRGGPYRLDKGHPVHQISQAKKDEVSAEARAKARAMAEEALASRLNEIDMSEKEWEAYQRYFSRVEQESSQLRSVLDNLESFAQERTWIRHQSSGELDDAKLVDGVTGERLIYKRRGMSNSPFQEWQQSKPKRILFVMDVSGSMYRFNGQDGRLERVLETSLMIMESFAGFENRFDYAIMGHSGDSAEIPFVEFSNPPQDRKERLKVLQKMVAHSQYCMSGDHTVEAIQHATQRVVEADADDYFVFVVSDANLERYNISPRRLGRQLIADPRVKANAIFIASFADEADRILRELPANRGYVCLDTTDLPKLFKKIFTSAFGTQ